LNKVKKKKALKKMSSKNNTTKVDPVDDNKATKSKPSKQKPKQQQKVDETSKVVGESIQTEASTTSKATGAEVGQKSKADLRRERRELQVDIY
jgi:hypothetical protein